MKNNGKPQKSKQMPKEVSKKQVEVHHKVSRSITTYKLFPFESFRDHPLSFLNYVRKYNVEIKDEPTKEAIKKYFKRIEERCDLGY